MAELVADCPRCRAGHITLDLAGENYFRTEYNWQHWYEAFCICRKCHRGSVIILAQITSASEVKVRQIGLSKLGGSLNDYFRVEGYLSLKDEKAGHPPEYLPETIEVAFKEGATCMAVQCYNAAGTMFRLCLDFATKSMTPTDDVDGLTKRIRGSLGFRLGWLFDTGRLPEALRELAICVKDDGNDGAHDGTLTKADAEDLHEFAYELLERLYTEPRRLEIAKERRRARHTNLE